MKIGAKLKSFRKSKKMTLKELSEKSGVAIATLSRMEHDIMTGPLESHLNICKALGITLADFYREIEDGQKMVSVVQKKESHDTFIHQQKSTIEMLTTKIMDKKMMPILIRIKEGGQTHEEQNNPGTEKFIYILQGCLSVEIGNERYKLNKGDSLYFDSSLLHLFSNEGQDEVAAICIITPPVF